MVLLIFKMTAILVRFKRFCHNKLDRNFALKNRGGNFCLIDPSVWSLPWSHTHPEAKVVVVIFKAEEVACFACSSNNCSGILGRSSTSVKQLFIKSCLTSFYQFYLHVLIASCSSTVYVLSLCTE